MKRILLAVVFVVLLLGLTACEAPQEGDDDEYINASVGDRPEPSTGEGDFKGTWIRQATYTNGELVGQHPATLEFTDDSYTSSSSACSNSGSLEVTGDTMVMHVEQSNCPGPIKPGSSVSYQYSVEGDTMTVINTQYGAEVKEIYERE